MAKQKTKLELTWIGKENRPKVEPRVLIEDPKKSYHAKRRVSDNDIFDNRLIFSVTTRWPSKRSNKSSRASWSLVHATTRHSIFNEKR